MDLSDCPPGTEGYEDDGNENLPNIPIDASKGEREFAEYLHGIKLPLENGTTGRMLEQRLRDQSGQMVYVCYPCSVTLYGEYMAKTHLDGRKHISKLESRKLWPKAIYDNHPINAALKTETSVVQKPAVQAAPVKSDPSPQSNEFKFDLTIVCQIQEDLDKFHSNALIGLEYLVEILPKEERHALSYCCILCTKTGHNSTMLNHLICMQHNFRYISLHFKEMYFAIKNLKPNRVAFQNVMDSLMRAIEENYGRMRPVQVTQIQWESHNADISRAVTRREHVSEHLGKSFLEILDADLMQHLSKDSEPSTEDVNQKNVETQQKKKDPSPPVVAAPSRPANYRSRKEASPAPKVREGSLGALSNVSSDHSPGKNQSTGRSYRDQRDHPRKYPHGHESDRSWSRGESSDHRGSNYRGSHYRSHYDSRYPPSERYRVDYRDREHHSEMSRVIPDQKAVSPTPQDTTAPENMSAKSRSKLFFKLKIYTEKVEAELDNALKVLAYHEKNPEKHPQYPDEWKKFWNRRYKEVKAENKDPSTYDFKPEWIIFWTKRMVALHEEKMEGKKKIYRKQFGFPIDKSPTREPPTQVNFSHETSPPHKHMVRSRSRSPRRRPPSVGRRSRSPMSRRHSPYSGRFSPHRRYPSPRYGRRLSTGPRSREISRPRDVREIRHSKLREDFRTSSSREEVRPSKSLDDVKTSKPRVELRKSRTRSPFSARASKGSPDRLASRNRSPQPVRGAEDLSPMSMSDEDNPKMRANAGVHSPWDSSSSSSLESVRSMKRNSSPPPAHRAPSSARPHYEARKVPAKSEARKVLTKPPASTGPEDVVPVLRLLAALEDYLGPSIGPKILDLLGEALRMEKEKPNSSENILDVEMHTALLEMGKEKLKGKVEAGLVGTAATVAAREVISRTAALLHLAEIRKQERRKAEVEAVRVKGIGAVDKAAVARQLAAALVAQGKTDVTTEELATLVDAVVGMAEARRRAGDTQQQPISTATFLQKITNDDVAAKGPQNSGLKMLQAAYEEQHRSEPKEEKVLILSPAKEVDAMDGLSDSDLKTLMQNFKDLSTDEQEGLVAYLKKLEVRNPKRVENLRQFVNFGSDETPASAPPPASAKMATPQTKTPTLNNIAVNAQQGQASEPTRPPPSNLTLIDSDDDDYTVEEVFKSAVKKVKEDLKQKEMEVVQKSIQHSKPDQGEESNNVTESQAAEAQSEESNASRMLNLLQSTAGRGLFDAFSTQPTTPSNTSNTDTLATARMNNVTDSNRLLQAVQNNNGPRMTDGAGWAQNLQGARDAVQPTQPRVYGDRKDSSSQFIEGQFSNLETDAYSGSQTERGIEESYQNQDTQYQQGQYPQEDSFSQQKQFSHQDLFTLQGDFSQQGQFTQQRNFSQQDQFQQLGNFSQQDPFQQQGTFSQQDQFQQEGDFSGQPFPKQGIFSQQDQILQRGNLSQDQFSQRRNILHQDQFSQQRNFSHRNISQENDSQQDQFQQGNDFALQNQYSQDNLAQPGQYSRQGQIPHRDQFSQGDNFTQQGNFQQGQFLPGEVQNRTSGGQNFGNRDQFPGGPMGGYHGDKGKIGGGSRARGGRGRGRGRGGRGGGQYPY